MTEHIGWNPTLDITRRILNAISARGDVGEFLLDRRERVGEVLDLEAEFADSVVGMKKSCSDLFGALNEWIVIDVGGSSGIGIGWLAKGL